MEAAACLRAVHGIRGGIEIQDAFGRRRRRVRVHEQVDEGPLHGVGIIQILVPEREPVPARPHERLDRMRDARGIAALRHAGGTPGQQAGRTVRSNSELTARSFHPWQMTGAVSLRRNTRAEWDCLRSAKMFGRR
jgi:hypothetical protein